MIIEKFFPPGIAMGDAFFNRVKERELVKQCILNNEHLVLVSPRRYGKTSLILKVIEENHFPHCAIDFLPATNQQYVKNAILMGVGDVLSMILPKSGKIKQKLLGFFENLNPKIILSALGQKIELTSQETPSKSIVSALMNLDKIAGELKKQVVFLMDEFQQIDSIGGNHEIEASIRHAVERSKNVAYIFSGSNRHILEQMFNDKKRPLYHLCNLVKIGRISREDYLFYLDREAKKKWKKNLPREAMDQILLVTERHTFYVSYLCRQLWKLPHPPTSAEVSRVWKEYVNEQLPWITDDVGKLSANQRSVLAGISVGPIQEPQGQAFSNRIFLLPASIQRALDVLVKLNFVYQDEDGYYHVLDPAIVTYLKSIHLFGFKN